MRPKQIVERILHDRWCKKQRARLTNTSPTIICNNCLGGVICHDLGLRFNSPTVNLVIQNFPLFIKHFEHYIQCDLVETRENGDDFPTGKLVSSIYPDIELQFMHDRSFEEAKEKWMTRRERINRNNMFFIMECYDNYFPEEFEEYKKLPYMKNKAVLTHSKHPEMKDAYYIGCCTDSTQEFVGGLTFEQKPFSGKRFLDDFDYVAFLNHGGNRSC